MPETKRMISPTGSQEEEFVDEHIRPRRLKDYIGQPVVREQMEIFIGAARARGDALDHTLILAPPVLVKPPCLILLHRKWARIYGKLLDLF